MDEEDMVGRLMDRLVELAAQNKTLGETAASAWLSSRCSSARANRFEKKNKELSAVILLLQNQIEELRGIVSGKKPKEQ